MPMRPDLNSRKALWLNPLIAWPSIRTSPLVGSIRRLIWRNNVDLPLPEVPIRHRTSPRRTFKLTLLTAGNTDEPF
ncbi:hypothetical protein D3C73_1406680 [compost metagenome]